MSHSFLPQHSQSEALVHERSGYVGRFAPSPSGPLHQGSLVAAVASYLDARANAGRWLVRIEDVDTTRSAAQWSTEILESLEQFGFQRDDEVVVQSSRSALYQEAFERMAAQGHVYGCACSRREVADSSLPGADGGLVYPGTCRAGLPAGREPRAWRFKVDGEEVTFTDRAFGVQQQNLARQVGDFVLKRADGVWAYQLAVVVDDGLQGVTDVVRGADLLGSTARQILLQRGLGYPTPRYLHVPVVTDQSGHKVSKQTGASPLRVEFALESLNAAARHLGLGEIMASSIPDFWAQALVRWAAAFPLPASSHAQFAAHQ